MKPIHRDSLVMLMVVIVFTGIIMYLRHESIKKQTNEQITVCQTKGE